MRLPSRIVLPFGYTVLVKQLTDAEMKAEVEDPEDFPDGLWDVDARTIFVRTALSLKRKRYILGHEMCHALADWIHDCMNEEAMRP